jgi:hypothetical protein
MSRADGGSHSGLRRASVSMAGAAVIARALLAGNVAGRDPRVPLRVIAAKHGGAAGRERFDKKPASP